MTTTSTFKVYLAHALHLDAPRACEEIVEALRCQVVQRLRRRGLVVVLSGGVDSSVVAALAVRALGRERVLGLCLPEREGSPERRRLGVLLGTTLGLELVQQDITGLLEQAGCYAARDAAVREVVPDYGVGWSLKVVAASPLRGEAPGARALIVRHADGHERRVPAPESVLHRIVAAVHLKERMRKLVEYQHAEGRAYALAANSSRLEQALGLHAKHGDGAADLKPIAHLYRTQVHELARFLGVPAAIRHQAPADPYAAEQVQAEFYSVLPDAQLDLCLYAHDHGLRAEGLAHIMGLDSHQVQAVFADIEAKSAAAGQLDQPALLVGRGDGTPVQSPTGHMWPAQRHLF